MCRAAVNYVLVFAAAAAFGPLFSAVASGRADASTSGGIYVADVYALAIDPSTPSTLYAGTWGGGVFGVFKSTDSGGTWTAVLSSCCVTSLAINPKAPATLYAGGGNGVFKSTDSGGTWTATGLGQIYALAIDPSTPSTLYAGGFLGGVFKSTDSGGTWAPANTGLSPGGVNVFALAVDPVTPSTLYVGTSPLAKIYDAVFKSTDSGRTWTAAGLNNQQIFSLAINPATPSTLYAAGDFVFKSTNSGGSWIPANTGLKTPFPGIYVLAINPTTPTTVYAGGPLGVFKSTDSGGTWAPANTGLTTLYVKALAIDPSTPSTLYAGTNGGGVFKSTDSGGTWGLNLYRFIPIVLDVTGFAHYTSELQITNLGANPTTVTLSYTGSIGTGSGSAQVIVPAGQQVVYPDAISYLRLRGVAIPTSGGQGGTLLLSSPAGGIHSTVRTGADTVAPQPTGRSGLAYTDTDPAVSSSKTYVYGLRTNDADRSNLAVYNMGADPVSLKVTLVSGDDGRSFEVTAGVPLVLPAYGWYQYSGVLNATGFSSGYAIIERVTGSGPFGAYGVVNDQMTNDGSFIPALSGTLSGSRLTIPVLVETGAFESELILTNRGNATATFTLRYFESISPAKGAGGTTTVDVAAGRQMIIPKAIDFLRSKGISIGARGETGYGGILQVQVSGVGLENVFAGARTSSLSLAGGEFGVFYPGIGSNQEFSELAFLLGLKADVNNRSNVAVLHTGDGTSGPITLELQVLDGSEGGKAVGQPLSVTLNPGQWAQPPGFFASGGAPNGYVRIRRTAGTAPWYAYGVINDGGQPGQRTGDGSYVPGVQP